MIDRTNPASLVGLHVRITRSLFGRSWVHVGTVVSAGPYEGAAGGLALMFQPDHGNRTGFHLPDDATIEVVSQSPNKEGR